MMKIVNMRTLCWLAFLVATPLALADLKKQTLIAAHKGDVVAMRKIGYMKFYGKDASLDRENGLAWLKKAAEEGDAQAMYYLACIYEEGTYVGKDMATARRYLRQAAGNGHEKAKKKLLSGKASTSEVDLMSERASMVDKSLPYGALAGDYFESVKENIDRAKQLRCTPMQWERSGYSSERRPMKENTPRLEYIEAVEKTLSGIYVLYYLASKYENTLEAGDKAKIEAIYKGIQEIGMSDSKTISLELSRYDMEARKLGEKIFGSDMKSEGVRAEALKHSWPIFAEEVLLHTRATCEMLYNNGVGGMLEKILKSKYGKNAVEWNFKWKICSLIDVFGGDIMLLNGLREVSDSKYESYRSELLNALEVKYKSSKAFREHVSKTLDMLRAKDEEDKLIVDKYITELQRAHFIMYMVPSLGQMCEVSL